MKRVVAIVGMTGSGKTEVVNWFVEKGYVRVHFGQITFDEVKRLGLDSSEANERKAREGLRKKHGMGAYAKLLLPRIEGILKAGDKAVLDGLYSWSEYKILKEKYDDIVFIAVYASPKVRYGRLEQREGRRPQPEEESKARDYGEIEGIEKGGPIAMADYTIVNEGSHADLQKAVAKIFKALA